LRVVHLVRATIARRWLNELGVVLERSLAHDHAAVLWEVDQKHEEGGAEDEDAHVDEARIGAALDQEAVSR